MKILKLGLIALSMLTIFTSCDDLLRGAVLEVELPEYESELSPYAFFKDTDTVLTVMVGKSVGVLDTINPDVVYDATVELYKNGTLEYTFTYNNNIEGYQVNLGQPFSPTAGDEYELKVSASGYEPTSATQIVPQKVAVDSVEWIPQGSADPTGGYLDVINVTFRDPANEINYYAFGGYIEITYLNPFDSTTYTNQNSFWFTSNDPNFEDGILADGSFDGDEYTVRLETWSSFWGNPDDNDVKGEIHFSSTTTEYARYKTSLTKYWDAQDNPFSEPVILYSNMSGGTGVFGLLVTDVYEF